MARILYIDIDSLRPDHLGAYGYHRDTSPVIDGLAARGARLKWCYASDVPCMPSRTATFFGRTGFQSGVVNHGGRRGQPYEHLRGNTTETLRSRFGDTGLVWNLKHKAGLRTATISSFAERHSAWHFLSGFDEVINTGHLGHELADDVTPKAEEWLRRNGADDDWFLHVQYWDVHVPYRPPTEFGRPFKDQPSRTWIDDQVLAEHMTRPGMRAALDIEWVRKFDGSRYPLQPSSATSLEDVELMLEGCDTAVRYVDTHIGRLMALLEELGIAEDTAIIVTADHGECLGELASYCGHHMADEHTAHVPLIVSWPGMTVPEGGLVLDGLHYQFDLSASLLDLLQVAQPAEWQARSFAPALRGEPEPSHDFLVLSQMTQMCQRSVRYRLDGSEYLLIRTYQDGYQGLPDCLLFDLAQDPHEQNDLTASRPEAVRHGLELLQSWTEEQKRLLGGPDPMLTVLQDGPQTLVGMLEPYLERLEQTGRSNWANTLRQRYLT